MPLKTYTITATGQTSNGNALAQPFTVEVHQLHYANDKNFDTIAVEICTVNGSGESCDWDQIEEQEYVNGRKEYDPCPVSTTSKNADLVATLEVDLEAAVPGKWS